MKFNENKEYHIGHLISTARRNLHRRMNRIFSESGLNITWEQFVVLCSLSKNGTQNQQQIADEVQKDKYSITRFINGLENNGFVQRSNDPGDRRVNLVNLTDMGIKIKNDAKLLVRNTTNEVLKDINESDREIFFSVLINIINAFTDE